MTVQVGASLAAGTFNTVAIARISDISATATSIVTLGFDVPGDSRLEVWARATEAPAHGAYFTAGDDSIWEYAATDGIYANSLGAKADCLDTHDPDDADEDGFPTPNGEYSRDSTDNTPIFAICQAFSNEKGVPILLGACEPGYGYRCYSENPAAGGGYVDTTGQFHYVKGVGASSCRVFIDEDDEDTAGAQALFGDSQSGVTYLEDNPPYTHEGIEFRGRWHHLFALGEVGNEGCGVGLTVGRKLESRNCNYKYIRTKAYLGYGDNTARFINFTGYCVAEGLYRGLGSDLVYYLNGVIEHTSDDAFDPANADAQPTDVPGRAGVIIDNVTLIDCQPVAVVGARESHISNLTLRRCKGGMSVGIEAANGASSVFGWSINGLIIEDGLEAWTDASQALVGNGDTLSANLAIGGSRKTTSAISSVPGNYNYAAAQFYPPYTDAGTIPGFGALHVSSSATYAVIGGYMNQAANVKIIRTLPDATKYSDWGFGFYFNKNGWKDPAVLPANRLQSGLWLYGNHTGTLISNIIIAGMPGAAIYLYSTSAGRVYTVAPATSDARKYAFRDVIVDGFLISDCKRGTQTDFEGNTQTLAECSDMGITWRNGNVNLDPWFKSTLRAASGGHPTGGWTSDTTYEWRAFTVRNTKGQRFENITVSNCYAPFAGVNHPGQYSYTGIVVECQPVNTAYDAGNLGVAVPGGDDFEHRIKDCTPTAGGAANADYGRVINECFRSMLHNDALPIGTYMDGHVIKLRRGTISSGKKKTHLEKIGTNATWSVEGTDYRYLYATNS